MNEEVRQAVRLRVGQARETLEEAEALRAHGLWRGARSARYDPASFVNTAEASNEFRK